MTTNNTNMGILKECLQLNPGKKMRIKLDVNGKILYVNNYFTELTNFKISDIILKDLTTLFANDMPKMAAKTILDELHNNDSYIIYKGKIKDDGCYWGFVKSSIEYDEYNEQRGFLLQVKMLPLKAITKINKLYEILIEIENNAGLSAAEKYFYGYIEDKGMDVENFILNIAGVNHKQAEKYFQIDEDLSVKKKKRSWF